jgi:hypothetical protein
MRMPCRAFAILFCGISSFASARRPISHRCAQPAMLAVLIILAGFCGVSRVSAQSACAQLGVNCGAGSVPPASAPQCYDPATGAVVSCSYQAPSSTQGSSTPRTPAPQSSATILNNAIQQQVMSSVMQSFAKMFFSDDPKADAQKQLMMKELQLRQAAAEKQHNIEEAQRLAAICNRLQASLKLVGLPALKMKGDDGGGGLQLKLSDSGSGSRHAGQAGLPGIALNDSTGNGGTTPYGIQGLPGIYTNGPGSESGSATSDGPKLSLKMEDGSTPPAPPAPVEGNTAGSNPPAEAALSTDTVTDVRKMSPQQLADLATKIDNLPPEEKQRLMDAARNSTGGNLSVGNPAPAGAAANPAPASAAASQPAQSQLQQIAATSQSAATAASPEDAAALARSGFDTPGGGSAQHPVSISGTTVAAIPAPTNSHPSATGNAPLPPASSAARASAPTYPVVPLLNMASPSGSAVPRAGAAPDIARHEMASAPCPLGVEKLVPTRQQLVMELAVRRAQVESLRNTILRMDRSIQLDQQQFAVWQDEASAAIDRLKGRIWDQSTKFAFDNFIASEEEHIKEMPISDAERADKLRKLKLVENIKDFDDFQQWALDNKGDWEMIDGGIRSLVDSLPLADEPLYYVHCAEDLIDNAYDLTDFMATWNNVQQLDHNSDQFLQAVRLNGQRMTALVQRIQTIQAQLNGTRVGPTGTPACHAVQAEMK